MKARDTLQSIIVFQQGSRSLKSKIGLLNSRQKGNYIFSSNRAGMTFAGNNVYVNRGVLENAANGTHACIC